MAIFEIKASIFFSLFTVVHAPFLRVESRGGGGGGQPRPQWFLERTLGMRLGRGRGGGNFDTIFSAEKNGEDW